VSASVLCLRRRYAMKPMPAKPSNSIARVEGSGTPPIVPPQSGPEQVESVRRQLNDSLALFAAKS
jgi:hypothetical protein